MPVDIQALLQKHRNRAVYDEEEGDEDEPKAPVDRIIIPSVRVVQPEEYQSKNRIRRTDYHPNEASSILASDQGSRNVVFAINEDMMSEAKSFSRERSLETVTSFYDAAGGVFTWTRRVSKDTHKPNTVARLASMVSAFFCHEEFMEDDVVDDESYQRNMSKKQLWKQSKKAAKPGFGCYAPDRKYDPKQEEAAVFMREFDESTHGSFPSREQSSLSGSTSRKTKKRRGGKEGYLDMMERMMTLPQDDGSLSRMEAFETISTEYTDGESMDESTVDQSIGSKPHEIVFDKPL